MNSFGIKLVKWKVKAYFRGCQKNNIPSNSIVAEQMQRYESFSQKLGDIQQQQKRYALAKILFSVTRASNEGIKKRKAARELCGCLVTSTNRAK